MTVVQYLNIYLTTPNAITRTLVFHLTICTSFHGICCTSQCTHSHMHKKQCIYNIFLVACIERERAIVLCATTSWNRLIAEILVCKRSSQMLYGAIHDVDYGGSAVKFSSYVCARLGRQEYLEAAVCLFSMG